MVKLYYKVTKPMKGFRINAEVGNIVYTDWWEGSKCIMKEGEPICEYDSPCHRQSCKLIKNYNTEEDK